MVGLFVLRQLWVGRDYLCPNRRSTSCIQLSDRAGGLRHQFGARHARAAAAWLDRCDARRNWRVLLGLLQRLSVGGGYCFYGLGVCFVLVFGFAFLKKGPGLLITHRAGARGKP